MGPNPRRAKMATAAKPLDLTSLPGEIQNSIINALDGLSQAALRSTNKYFRRMVPAADLRLVEQDPAAKDHKLYACFDCRRLRREHHFSDEQKEYTYSRGHSITRFCLDCGLHTRYISGTIVTKQGRRYIKCYCRRPGLQAVSKRSADQFCVHCWDDRQQNNRSDRTQIVGRAKRHKRKEPILMVAQGGALRPTGYTASDIISMLTVPKSTHGIVPRSSEWSRQHDLVTMLQAVIPAPRPPVLKGPLVSETLSEMLREYCHIPAEGYFLVSQTGKISWIAL